MGTKTNPGKYDCYSKAGPDEPLFVLRAKDPLAPMLVFLWSVLRMLDMHPGADMGQVEEAQDCAQEMVKWRRYNLIKAD